ncbi:uncharacterized protein LOC128388207 isoform X2 [Panonychus citri]|uniref:uncharacterized protein LOC128388207 isoform X2 n=1 Tax=Panonychus citri TaxID=50023 RepID=UPI002307D141|nr:uncharacterized protein LOC128388207 isoform X2 [Panonychus citri]
MELGDLPYDCLSCIFDRIPDLKSLLDMSTVCKEWNILAKQRLKKIRHLHVESEFPLVCTYFSLYNHIYTDDVGLMERVNVSQLLPNLKFLTLSRNLSETCTCKMLVNVLSTSNPLVGLFCEAPCRTQGVMVKYSQCHVDIDEMVKHCGSLEYLDSLFPPFLDSYFFKYKFGQNLKYFNGYIEGYINSEEDADEDYDFRFEEINSLCRYLKQMPNLEVLKLGKPLIEPRLWPLPKMKLKEIQFEHISPGSPVFQFLPLLPDLRSIELNIHSVKDEDEDFPDCHTHMNVQDVVLNISGRRSIIGCYKLTKSILVKFPNCKNLNIFLRRELPITNEDLIEIIKALPNLTLFVLDLWNWSDANTIETLDKFCKSTGRQMSFYFRIRDRIRVGSYKRYALNEDVASPLKIDNEFLQKCFVY